MSHLGRPDGNANPKFTMKPVVAVLEVRRPRPRQRLRSPARAPP
jgi:hypothetical protein